MDLAQSEWGWSISDARRVLEIAASSPDPSLRALALSALVVGEDSRVWLTRGWNDPSATVQRALAISHPTLLTAGDLTLPRADVFAVAWVLQEYPDGDALREQVLQQNGLVLPFLGGASDVDSVLSDLRDGMVPPEQLFVDVVVRSGIAGAAEAMAMGALHAEEEMRLPLALGALQMAAVEGGAALDEVLRDADELTEFLAVESLTKMGGDRSVSRLKRTAKGEDEALSQYARVGLVALGHVPLDEAVRGLSAADRDLRYWAATCLGLASEDRPLPRSVIVALQGTWRDESIMVREAATKALIAGAGVESVPLAPLSLHAEVDAVATIVAGKWLAHHEKRRSSSQ